MRRSPSARLAATFAALVVVPGALAWTAVSVYRSRVAEGMRRQMAEDIEVGSLERLLHAHAVGLRLVAARGTDTGAGASLALAAALLAREQGLPLDAEVERVAASLGATEGASAAHQGTLGAARALAALGGGRVDDAAAKARAAISAWPAGAAPRFSLARVLAHRGDLPAAAAELAVARIRAPTFASVAVAWTELRLDMGDAPAAMTTLREWRARAPGDERFLLLDEEARLALGRKPAEVDRKALAEACGRQPFSSPSLAARCLLSDASASRLRGDNRSALGLARQAAEASPTDPRLLGRIAQILALLGEVDDAAALVARGVSLGAAHMPAVAWADLAVALGRSELGAEPDGVRPASPESRSIGARAALVSGGAAGLRKFLRSQSDEVVAADPDLDLHRRFAARVAGGKTLLEPDAMPQPGALYLEGLAARFVHDAEAAARLLRGALDGHADACRAAGEYLTALTALGRPQPDAATFDPLRRRNARCRNLTMLRR